MAINLQGMNLYTLLMEQKWRILNPPPRQPSVRYREPGLCTKCGWAIEVQLLLKNRTVNLCVTCKTLKHLDETLSELKRRLEKGA